MAEKYWPENNIKIQQELLKKTQNKYPEATLDDARDLYVTHIMLNNKPNKKAKSQTEINQIQQKAQKR